MMIQLVLIGDLNYEEKNSFKKSHTMSTPGMVYATGTVHVTGTGNAVLINKI